MARPSDRTLDVRGQRCPMPIIKAKKEYETLPPGQVLKVLATDKASVFDFQSLVKNLKGAQLLEQETVTEGGADVYVHYIKHGG